MSDRPSTEAHNGTTTHAPRGSVATAMKVVDADPEQIWRALTDPVLVEQYFFGTHVESDWQPGSPITYRGEWDGRPYEDRGTVLEIREPLRLVTDFFSPQSGLPDEPANHQVVSYRIQPIDGGCRVTVEQDNNADDEAAARSSSNWQAVLDGLATVAPTA